MNQPVSPPNHDDLQQANKLQETFQNIRLQIGKVIVGQDKTVEQLLIAILAGGHCLLEGVPGLAKTLMVRSLAQAMDLQFQRIQFTPDLMPASITRLANRRGRSSNARLVLASVTSHRSSQARN